MVIYVIVTDNQLQFVKYNNCGNRQPIIYSLSHRTIVEKCVIHHYCFFVENITFHFLKSQYNFFSFSISFFFPLSQCTLCNFRISSFSSSFYFYLWPLSNFFILLLLLLIFYLFTLIIF